jgi:hypothetical protein
MPRALNRKERKETQRAEKDPENPEIVCKILKKL